MQIAGRAFDEATVLRVAHAYEQNARWFERRSSGMKKKSRFQKILIANRGEIAVRVIRACRELGIQHGRRLLGIRSRRFRRAYGGRSICHWAGTVPRESYLVIEKIIDTAKRSQGGGDPSRLWLFLPKTHPLRMACEDSGIVFIGPSAESITLMGSKIGRAAGCGRIWR
jgi:acetyl/propionyl-CoA carboxylase alpha subunit